MKLLLILALALTAGGALAQSPQITIPLSPPTWTVNVNQSVTINNQSYTVTGTLTLTPKGSGTAELPEPFITDASAAGAVEGQNFGTKAGRLLFNAMDLPLLTWSDGLITFPPPTGGGFLTVWRPDGHYYSGSMN